MASNNIGGPSNTNTNTNTNTTGPSTHGPGISLGAVPKGFHTMLLLEGHKLLIPTALLPHLHQAFSGYRKKIHKHIGNARIDSPAAEQHHQVSMVGSLFAIPPNPPFSKAEALELHAKVLALQQQLGISYKDASHRLYMAEVKKLKVYDKQAKMWATVGEGIKDSMKDISECFKMELTETESQQITDHKPESSHVEVALRYFVDNPEEDPDYTPEDD